MSGYNVWTKHGEEGVMIEDGDEEDNDDNYRSMFSEYDDTAMEDNEEEGGEERGPDEPGDDDLCRPFLMQGETVAQIRRGFLDVYGKTKDTTEAREDQQRHKGRDGNHPGQFQGPGNYALTKEEKEIFFEALFSIKLQVDVVECLVSFELLFPPSFFNIMTHLLVHLVDEIRIPGPVFLHNMFPFERFMGVLKKYVHNRARPEGSISKGYGTEEVIEFCVDFLPDLKPIGVPESRYEGRLTGKGTLGRKTTTEKLKLGSPQTPEEGRSKKRRAANVGHYQPDVGPDQFMRIVFKPTFSRLRIPQDFVRWFGEIPSNIILKTNTGCNWRMTTAREGDDVYIDQGWAAFAIAHQLQVGQFLIF
ncbi:hypothetical protein QYE76_060167 [Lolium multiflorum]|uniref:TF-B3 domain-containing protein n=1 Tax=Lolium multiflorum TaxID=4521 RepID=A0AAD8W694_LOLMU|nr:hypothetical protein QYE76_060167 [Lolium multiflorum]